MAGAQGEDADLTEEEVRGALERLDPLWDKIFPAEQTRIIQLLVERLDVGTNGAAIKMRVDGLAGLAREFHPASALREAA